MSEKIRLTPEVKNRLPDADPRDMIRFCPKCGREIPADRQVCVSCGNTGAIPRPRQSGKQKFLILCGILFVLLLLLLGTVLFTRVRPAAPAPVPTAVPTVSRGTAVPVILLDD